MRHPRKMIFVMQYYYNPTRQNMEYNLNFFLEMEDDLNFFNGRRPHFSVNGRWSQLFSNRGQHKIFFWIEDSHNFFQMEDEYSCECSISIFPPTLWVLCTHCSVLHSYKPQTWHGLSIGWDTIVNWPSLNNPCFVNR